MGSGLSGRSSYNLNWGGLSSTLQKGGVEFRAGKSKTLELECQQHPAQPRDLGWQLGSGQGCSSVHIWNQELVFSPARKAGL